MIYRYLTSILIWTLTISKHWPFRLGLCCILAVLILMFCIISVYYQQRHLWWLWKLEKMIVIYTCTMCLLFTYFFVNSLGFNVLLWSYSIIIYTVYSTVVSFLSDWHKGDTTVIPKPIPKIGNFWKFNMGSAQKIGQFNNDNNYYWENSLETLREIMTWYFFSSESTYHHFHWQQTTKEDNAKTKN